MKPSHFQEPSRAALGRSEPYLRIESVVKDLLARGEKI